uniref:Uncharacterized protein n=1 Tax=Romanomermis culicivorax TaxID=13658 RepID=A0A915IBK8_ROMCU
MTEGKKLILENNIAIFLQFLTEKYEFVIESSTRDYFWDMWSLETSISSTIDILDYDVTVVVETYVARKRFAEINISENENIVEQDCKNSFFAEKFSTLRFFIVKLSLFIVCTNGEAYSIACGSNNDSEVKSRSFSGQSLNEKFPAEPKLGFIKRILACCSEQKTVQNMFFEVRRLLEGTIYLRAPFIRINMHKLPMFEEDFQQPEKRLVMLETPKEIREAQKNDPYIAKLLKTLE